MELLLSHWHCVLPIAAILIGLFLLSRGKSKDKDGTDGRTDSSQNIRELREENDSV
jgi:hypothetical protein